MPDEITPAWQSEEWQRIRSRRDQAFGGPKKEEAAATAKEAEPKNLVGLSLSGGGIRSAIYNDGFLQGLSHRGFLRYVDYLCSVSGGGYIAGHLASQSRASHDKGLRCFHDDEDRRNLGRDPITGKVCANRLAGVGGYLSRTMEFLPAYLWSFFFSFAFYIGITGIVATIAALFWRSFDDPTFRSLYSGTLGLIRGGELGIAFIPAILLFVLATVSEVGLSMWRLFFGFDRPLPKRIQLTVRKASLLLVSLAVLTSIAIFIGNGKTNVGSGSGGELFLNNYAQFLALAAGVIHLLVFLGRERLFRSERAEAKQWQKHLQRSVTTVVLLFLVFSMVHWMGREDISGYTHNRDPHLVRGDVTNWYVLDQLFARYETKDGTTLIRSPEQLNPLDLVPPDAKPPSRWSAFLAAGQTGLGLDNWKPGDDFSDPPSPLQVHPPQVREEPVWSLPKRIEGACIAYWLVTFNRTSQESIASPPLLPIKYEAFSSKESTYGFVSTAFNNIHLANRIQDSRLSRWNLHLEDLQFTAFLIDGPSDVQKPVASTETLAATLAPSDRMIAPNPTDPSAILVSKQIKALVDSIGGKLTASEQKSLTDTFRRLPLGEYYPERAELPSERLATATSNRLLLEVLFPGAVQTQKVASTLVVPPHDQNARQRWLCFWAVLTMVGMIGGLGQNHVATVFQFYRQQLGSNFLVATHNPARQLCNKQLYELHPTDDGLPYPLFLAATLEPSTQNGSYQVEAQPFVFSPLFCGRFDSSEGPIPSKQLSFSSSPASPAVTLGDAITLSGAAVTPLMTGNRWLSIILDFFNTGIGQRLRRLDRTGNEIRRLWTKPIVTSAIVILVTALVTYCLIGLSPMMVVVFALLTCLTCYCIVMRIGSPGLISSLLRPRNRDVNNPTRDDGRSFYVADGGFYDYLGVTELLRRRCELIVVSDTGANIGNDPLGTLAQMCEKASQEMGIRFLDLDHEAPIDFGRLKLTEKRLVHQPFLCMRIRYPDSNTPKGRAEPKLREGRLFYCQMSITENDPIEIQHIRNRFPSFPDEPTVNQFYSEEQVSAYRALGYHIANRLCNELHSWQNESPAKAELNSSEPVTNAQPQRRLEKVNRFRRSLLAGNACARFGEASGQASGQPLFDVLRERLLTAYRLACYEELTYRKDDIFSEAIWMNSNFAFPAFRGSVVRVMSAGRIERGLTDRWLREYEHNADLRSAYRTAVNCDVNSLDSEIDCYCEVLWSAIATIAGEVASELRKHVLAAHLTIIATACQEIHNGRPHSTFQIGGRDKLINLCQSFSEVICKTFEQGAEGSVDQEEIFSRIDQVIAELIELERSVFQGGEHVTAISFAQCMSTMWGRIVRKGHEEIGLDNDDLREQLAFILKNVNSLAYRKSIEEATLTERSITEFQVTELRHRLDLGLKDTRVRVIRDALVKSWCIGYFKMEEIQAEFDFPTKPTEQKDQRVEQQKPVAPKKKG